jgi:hypothetical protein
MSAASRGPLAGGFLPKRFAQKPREKLGVWFQLQLLAARSRPEAEPNSHIISGLLIGLWKTDIGLLFYFELLSFHLSNMGALKHPVFVVQNKEMLSHTMLPQALYIYIYI